MSGATPPQTVGPFFAILIPARGRLEMAGDETPGEPVTVDVRIRDGEGRAVPDALIEIWQANTAGVCNHPDDPRSQGRDASFDGFGRIHADPDGRVVIRTIKPGAVPGSGGVPQAPHLLVSVFARGLLTRVVTRIYFADDAANAADPVLRLVPQHRRSTLLATPEGDGRYRFDVVLQGSGETVFFDV